jgi:hypothetical protein
MATFSKQNPVDIVAFCLLLALPAGSSSECLGQSTPVAYGGGRFNDGNGGAPLENATLIIVINR